MRFSCANDNICIVVKDIELKRKINDKLIRWKNASDGHTALLVEDAIRVRLIFRCARLSYSAASAEKLVDYPDCILCLFLLFFLTIRELRRYPQLSCFYVSVILFR